MSHCVQCRGVPVWREYPRHLTSQRDRETCRAREQRVTHRGTVTWVARLFCDCQWAAQLRYLHADLLALLPADPAVQRARAHHAQRAMAGAAVPPQTVDPEPDEGGA